MSTMNNEMKELLEKYELDKKVGIDSSVLAKFILSSISSLENLRDSFIEKVEKEKRKDSDDDEEFIEQMYKLYPPKCPIQNRSLGKSSKDKDRIKQLMKKYSKDAIEFVIRNEINQKYNKSWMSNFSTFLNNFPDPTQIDGYKAEAKPSLPNGWTQERYDMYIRNGYTITDDGRLFKDGREIK